MADEICVEVTDVSHSFGKTRALDHVSIRIPRGTTVGLVGADGVGKSTLMSLMAGTRIIQSGKVEVFGLDMSKRSTRDALSHKVAFMPQGLGRNLYKTLSVMENINFHASLFGIPRKERKARIERLLQATALDPFADRPAGKLSGGMKQKLSLCCALVHSPDFLILDEPTTGVDPLSRRQFWELLRSLMKETPGMTVLVSTAYIDEAENFENVVVMDDGKIICHENTKEFIKRESCSNLEDAYMKALPPGKRGKEGGFHIPPYEDVPGEEPVIEAQHLTKRFGSFTAVNDVSFRIRKGEIFGFLGSNGCGKSTTMKMLTGLLDPRTSSSTRGSTTSRRKEGRTSSRSRSRASGSPAAPTRSPRRSPSASSRGCSSPPPASTARRSSSLTNLHPESIRLPATCSGTTSSPSPVRSASPSSSPPTS